MHVLSILLAVVLAHSPWSPQSKPRAARPPATATQTFNRQLRTSNGTLPSTLKLHWKFKTGGPVVSSAAVAGDRLFIGSSDKNVYALSLRDGHRLWAYKTK